jgi:hypothetical protein
MTFLDHKCVRSAGPTSVSAGFRRVREIAKNYYYLRRVCSFVRPSVGSTHRKSRLPLGGFSLNLLSEDFAKNLSRKYEFHLNLTRITGTLRENLLTFTILPR